MGWVASWATPFLGHSIAPSSCASSLFHYYLWFAAAIANIVVVGVDVVVIGVVPSGRTITSPCVAVCHLIPWWSRPSYA